MMTTSDDIQQGDRIAQMADALIAHLGGIGAAAAFADRQTHEAAGDARETWAALTAHLERRRDRP